MSKKTAVQNQHNSKIKLHNLRLTGRELQIIEKAIVSASLQQLAEGLGAKPNTVYFYLQNIQAKVTALANPALD